MSTIDGLIICYSNLPSDFESVKRRSVGEPFSDWGQITKNRLISESTDFLKCFCLNPQCSSHSWDMMMVEPSWETALVKGQFALFTLIMGRSTCRWHCNESSDARKNHQKGGVFWHSHETRLSRAILFVCQWKANLQRSDFTDDDCTGLHVHLWGCVECTKASQITHILTVRKALSAELFLTTWMRYLLGALSFF